MGGSSTQRTRSTQSQQQQSQTQLGSTPYATPFLPQYSEAAQNAANMGGYLGQVVAPPTQADRYTPNVPDSAGFVADPGAPLTDYTPDVQMLDRYIAGATPTSRAGLNSSVDWASLMSGQVQGTAGNMGDFWNRVSSGYYLDPNTNAPLQNYLNTMSEGARDEFDRNAQQFQSSAIDAGAYGGTGYGRGMAWGLDEANQNDLAQRGNILYQNYLNEMGRTERAGAGAQSAYSLGLLPGQTLMGLGDVERGYNQMDIQNALAYNQELERGQALDIQDESLRRQDTALRNQALLDNQNALANWNIFQQQNNLQDEAMRRNVDQMIRQADITNTAANWDAQRYGVMDAWERYFQGLSNPVFGESSSGSMTGQSDTRTSTSQPAWQSILGGLSAAAQMYGAFTGNPMAAMGGGGGQQSQGQFPAPQTMQPINIPQINFGNYFANQGSYGGGGQVPWYLQPLYNAQPGGGG